MMKKHGQDAIYYARRSRRNPPEAHFESKTKKRIISI
jgi:hypothetical protein